jgi:pantoate--beta-alanine ligase
MTARPASATTIAAVREAVAAARRRGATVGLVPTMGALHEGHASLLRAARQETGFVVATIFVNPTQFGPHEDFGRYPRTLEADLKVCAAAGVDLVFAPEAAIIYPPAFCTYVEVHGLQDGLCGADRPGHFRGVATVVLKLFNIVQPDIAYFGQKDAQQVIVIRRMVADLNMGMRIEACPTVREPDGLAMSSRNAHLSPGERARALALHHALAAAAAAVSDGERRAEALIGAAREAMAPFDIEPEYLALVSPDTLEPVERLQEPALLAVAARVGSTRLIDNVVLHPSARSVAQPIMQRTPASQSSPPVPQPAMRSTKSSQANPREAQAICSA